MTALLYGIIQTTTYYNLSSDLRLRGSRRGCRRADRLGGTLTTARHVAICRDKSAIAVGIDSLCEKLVYLTNN